MEAPTSPPIHTSSKRMWVSKFVLRIFTAVCAIVLVGLAGSSVRGAIGSVLPIICLGPPGVLGFGWSIAEVIALTVRGGHRGIHPGANVGVDLVCWLALLAGCILLGIGGATTPGAESFWFSPYGYYYMDSLGVYWGAIAKGKAMLVLSSCLIVSHFATFVIACYETNLRNRMAVTKIVYVTVPPPYAEADPLRRASTARVVYAPSPAVRAPPPATEYQAQEAAVPKYYRDGETYYTGVNLAEKPTLAHVRDKEDGSWHK